MVVDIGEVGPRRMASATLRPAHPYSDRATVLSQCHDGASGGSLLGVGRPWRGKLARLADWPSPEQHNRGVCFRSHHPGPRAVTGVVEAAGRVWPGAPR